METKWIIFIYFFFKFNWIFHCKQLHFTIYFPKHRDIIVFISEYRHWPSTIASQYISFRVGQRTWNDNSNNSAPSIRYRHSREYNDWIIRVSEMMNWPNKFLIWSSTSTLALSIDTLQRNAAQITDKYRQPVIIKVLAVFTVCFCVLLTEQEEKIPRKMYRLFNQHDQCLINVIKEIQLKTQISFIDRTNAE